jgi:hypothetical protein
MYLSSPAIQGSTNRRMEVQVSMGTKQNPISKVTNAKPAGGLGQVVKYCLASRRPCVQILILSKKLLRLEIWF